MSSIMSILVHALNLRSSADEEVDSSPSGKGRLSETSQRRWLECILTRDHFRTPWCSLIVALIRTFLRHQLRLCMCYANLPRFLLKCSILSICGKSAICASYTKLCTFRFFDAFTPGFLVRLVFYLRWGGVMRRFAWKHEGYVRLNATYISLCILLFSADVACPWCASATSTSKRGMGDSWKVFYSSMPIQRT